MSVRQGVTRVAKGLRNAALFSVVLGSALGPTLSGSAHPVRLVPGQWYAVAPAAEHARSPAAAAAVLQSSAPAKQIPDSMDRNHMTQAPYGTAFFAVLGCLAVLAAGLLPRFRTGLKAFFVGHDTVPSFLPEGRE